MLRSARLFYRSGSPPTIPLLLSISMYASRPNLQLMASRSWLSLSFNCCRMLWNIGRSPVAFLERLVRTTTSPSTTSHARRSLLFLVSNPNFLTRRSNSWAASGISLVYLLRESVPDRRQVWAKPPLFSFESEVELRDSCLQVRNSPSGGVTESKLVYLGSFSDVLVPLHHRYDLYGFHDAKTPITQTVQREPGMGLRVANGAWGLHALSGMCHNFRCSDRTLHRGTSTLPGPIRSTVGVCRQYIGASV